MLIATASSPAAFLRAYDRRTTALPQRLLLNGFAFVLTRRACAGVASICSGVVLGGDIPLDLGAGAMAPAAQAYARAFPRLRPESAHGPLALPLYIAAEAVARALERVDGDPGRTAVACGRRCPGRLRRACRPGAARPQPAGGRRRCICAASRGAEGARRTVPFRVVEDVDQGFGWGVRSGARRRPRSSRRSAGVVGSGVGRRLRAGLPGEGPGEAGVAVAWGEPPGRMPRRTSRTGRSPAVASVVRERAEAFAPPALGEAESHEAGIRARRRAAPPAPGRPAAAPPERRARAVPPATRSRAGGWRRARRRLVLAPARRSG